MDEAQRITIDIPRAVVADILLERLAQLGAPRIVGPRPIEPTPIGAPRHGGIYAGLTIHDNAPCMLILLDGEKESIAWPAATAWAEQFGATLPSRVDALVLFQNLRSEFKEEPYWTDTPSARTESYAWFQTFYYGYQYYLHKGNELRARAVRRLPIE